MVIPSSTLIIPNIRTIPICPMLVDCYPLPWGSHCHPHPTRVLSRLFCCFSLRRQSDVAVFGQIREHLLFQRREICQPYRPWLGPKDNQLAFKSAPSCSSFVWVHEKLGELHEKHEKLGQSPRFPDSHSTTLLAADAESVQVRTSQKTMNLAMAAHRVKK